MSTTTRSAVIGTRTSSDTKARFAALAARRGLTESALLALVIDEVLASNAEANVPVAARIADAGSTNERLTLRLRPGDRALVNARAASRGMKTASYLSMLVRSHVRELPVMPAQELEELRCVAGVLASLGRQLRSLCSSGPSAPSISGADILVDARLAVEDVRAAVAAVVRTNLKSWETGHA